MIFVFIFLILFTTTLNADAAMKVGGYQTNSVGVDQGEVYSKSAFPLCVETDINYSSEDLTNLHQGSSTSRNFFTFVEVGDGGIHRAMLNGKLNKASFVSTKVHKINIPIGYLPLYYRETKTIVHGTKGEDKL